MKKQLFISMIVGLLIMVGCTIPKPIEPIFKNDGKEIVKQIQSFGNFEKVAVTGSAISHGTESSSILLIQLLNGNTSEANRNEIGKKAMKLVINSIKNVKDFTKFRVVFILKSKDVGVTKSISIPIEFNKDDLK